VAVTIGDAAACFANAWLVNRLSSGGDIAAAPTAVAESVTIRRGLATANPARFEPDLPGSMAHEARRRGCG
jgi:hypothetical protein